MTKKIRLYMLKISFVVCAAACLTAPAYAIFGVGDIVTDPGLTMEQMLHYITMCGQYETQIQQYQNQIRQIQNEYQHLQNLDFRVDLSGLNDMKHVLTAATGISNDFVRMQTQFEQQYPDFDSYRDQNSVSYAQQALKWNRLNQQNALDILKTGTKLQESIYRDQDTLRYLSDRSDSASGTKDLLQAMNQLLILQTKQLMQLEQLLTQTAKADAGYLAERSSRDAAESTRYRQQRNTRDNTNDAVVYPNLDRLH
jgi:type IV secretion system protein TrbJ